MLFVHLFVFSCKSKTYSEVLPKASVVICFYNEAWSALMRTLHTVIARTPANLLEEIVLVDDKSSLPHLSQQLEFTLAQELPIVKLIRTKTRQGLIRARILGAEHARGEVIEFFVAIILCILLIQKTILCILLIKNFLKLVNRMS